MPSRKTNAALRHTLTQAQALLADRSPPADPASAPQPISALLERAAQLAAARPAPEPVRSLHHFACTGGTLIAKALAVMPNTVVLSEIDPLSRLDLDKRKTMFAPTDVLLGMRRDIRADSDEDIIAIFNAAIETLVARLQTRGQHLIVRDHAHSQYCSGAILARPSLRGLMARAMPVRSLLTLRHPLHSFASLMANKWVHFAPGTLDQYCQRYTRFLEDHGDVPQIRYEDFVADPESVLEQICGILALPYRAGATALIGDVTLSGDSGRSGAQIAARAPRDLPQDLINQSRQSPSYARLCQRLGYDPVAVRPDTAGVGGPV